MNAETSTASVPDNTASAPIGFAELTETELDGLIDRITQAKEHGLALSANDYALLLNALLTLANMQERLSNNDLTIHKLKKLMGMVRSSEKLRDLVPPDTDESTGQAKPTGSRQRSGKRPVNPVSRYD